MNKEFILKKADNFIKSQEGRFTSEKMRRQKIIDLTMQESVKNIELLINRYREIAMYKNIDQQLIFAISEDILKLIREELK